MSGTYIMMKLRGVCAEHDCVKPSTHVAHQIDWETEEVLPYELCDEHAQKDIARMRAAEAKMKTSELN